MDLAPLAPRTRGVKAAALTAVVLASAVLAPAAGADGLPVQDVEVGQTGVEHRPDAVRYVAVNAGRQTVVHRVRTQGGQVQRTGVIHGRYTIPAVAYDGSAAGLSADGSTLVLISPRTTFPRAKTTFAVLDATRLQLREKLTLAGDFSFDALSPTARWLYLIQYTSAVDPVRYQVRALDLLNGKLHPEPVVDKREPDEDMNGHPLTRATSPDGRWAYTLYEGTRYPFVHALDTVDRDARCIDLDWLRGRKDLWKLRFALNAEAGRLSVRSSDKAVALVDTRTFEASVPRARSTAWPWLVVLAAGLVIAALFAYRSWRRTRSRSVGAATSA